MFNKNGNPRKAIGGILVAATLLIVPGGLVSCGVGGEQPAGETEERRNEDNDERDESDNDNNDRSDNEDNEDDDKEERDDNN